MEPIKRNILLNPGPATTTDTVKYAQVVPDICPREKEFAGLMKGLRSDLLKVVHAPEDQYTSVLFCGSGTINIDIWLILNTNYFFSSYFVINFINILINQIQIIISFLKKITQWY